MKNSLYSMDVFRRRSGGEMPRKSAKKTSAENRVGFLLGVVKRRGVGVWNVWIDNVRKRFLYDVSRLLSTEWPPVTPSPSFSIKTPKTSFFGQISENSWTIVFVSISRPSPVRMTYGQFLQRLESDTFLAVWRAGSNFHDRKRQNVYILRIQRCGT